MFFPPTKQNNKSNNNKNQSSIMNSLTPSAGLVGDHEPSSWSNEGNDCSDTTLKFINDMVMEEQDLDSMPCMMHDCLAFQAAQKSLKAVLNDDHVGERLQEDDFLRISIERAEREKKYQDELAGDMGESLDMYDNVLLSSDTNPQPMQTCNTDRSKGGRGKKRGAAQRKEPVDLRGLLIRCSDALSKQDFATANNTLAEIRLHSFPQGDSLQRLAHYLANALEARLSGTGHALYSALDSKRRSASKVLNAYKMFITACPFRKMSGLLANKAIEKLSTGESALHIIDFGILYGFQWPSLIQILSERQGGPPKLRITGIEFPQHGNRPAEGVEETGRRLTKYCERFGVPFEYNAISQNWETIGVEGLKIEKDELVVVNSLYRLHNLSEEIIIDNNPRDAVLKLIKNINPVMFIHGTSNANYNVPFFAARFKEALFHFTNMFDMFEATVPQEDENRLLFEEHVLGKMAMNVIACEGLERIERPELYRQWNFRMRRAGFNQLPLDEDVVRYMRTAMKTEYHPDFCVDEDGKWLLLGWKGRVNEAMSCWH